MNVDIDLIAFLLKEIETVKLETQLKGQRYFHCNLKTLNFTSFTNHKYSCHGSSIRYTFLMHEK